MKVKSESEVAQSCPTLSAPMDCSLPGSSIHGIFQARVLEWGAIAFSGAEGLDWLNGSKLFHLSLACLNSLRVTTIKKKKIKSKQKTKLSYHDNTRVIFSYPGTIPTTPNDENIIDNEIRLHVSIKALTFHFMEVLLF